MEIFRSCKRERSLFVLFFFCVIGIIVVISIAHLVDIGDSSTENNLPPPADKTTTLILRFSEKIHSCLGICG